MKLTTLFARALASLALIGFILWMPLALFTFNLGGVLFSAETLFRIVDNHVLTEETPDLLVQSAVTSTLGENEAASAVVTTITGNSAVMDTLFPRALWLELSRQMIDNIFGWYESPDDTLTFVLDLVPFKQYLNQNANDITNSIVTELPPCTLAESATWAGILLGGLFGGSDVAFEDLPQCVPAGQFEGVATAATALFTGQVSALPDTYVLPEVGVPEEMSRLKSNLSIVEFLMRAAWPLALMMLIVAFFLGGSTLGERFTWVGWPLVGAAIVTIGVMLAFPMVLALLASPYMAMVPSLLAGVARRFLEGISAEAQPRFLIQIVLMGGLGLALLVFGWVLDRRNIKHA